MRFLLLTLLFIILAAPSPRAAQAQPQEHATPQSQAEAAHAIPEIRHLYIPESRLSSLFKHDDISAVMSKSEFEALLEKARAAESTNLIGRLAPQIISSQIKARIEGDQLLAEIELQVSASQPLGECEFDVTGWNVISAKLDGEPAVVARVGKQANQLRLFVPAVGPQTLALQVACPLKNIGNDHLAIVGVPGAIGSEFQIELPAGKFLRINHMELKRPQAIEQAATYIVPTGGLKQLEIVITDRQNHSKLDLLTFASTAYGVLVNPGEITWSAQTELQVYGQTIDRLIFRVPQTLEVTRVDSEGLESWELSDDADHQGQVNITLKYRQPFEGSRTIQLQGILSQRPDQPWSVPALAIDQVTSHTGMIFLGHPANVRLQTIEATGVRTIPNPPVEKNPGVSKELVNRASEHLTYQVWQENFSLKFATSLKQQQVQAAMTSLLFAGESGLDLSVTLSLQTRQIPLFDARIQLPADYRIVSLSRDGAESRWSLLTMDAGVNEVRIELNPPLLPGQTTTVAVQAQNTPEKWPVRGTPLVVAIPETGLPQADMVEALLGFSAPADLELVPQELTGLDPATQAEMELLNRKLAESGERVRLGFTAQDTRFKGQLSISRSPTLFTAQTTTFFRVDRETVFSHIASHLSLTGGGFRELTLQLNESAGSDLRFSISPLSGDSVSAQLVEQIPGEVADGTRTWKLNFDRYLRGQYLLSTTLQQPRGEAADFSPPRLTYPQASAQSGFLAVEGPLDEQIQITAQSAEGTPLQTVDPVDLPPSSYRPQERIVAGYRYIRPNWTLKVTTTQFDREAVPTAIAHELLLRSVWSPGNAFQHQAGYRFSAVGLQSLLVKLPPEAELWSTIIDGQAVESRESTAGIQIPLTRLDSAEQHQLELVYNTPAGTREPHGELQAVPPIVSIVTGDGTIQPLSILQQKWDLHYPEETVLVGSSGAFLPQLPFWETTVTERLLKRFHFPGTNDLIRNAVALFILGIFLWALQSLFRVVTNNPVASSILVVLSVMVGLYVASLVLLSRHGPRSESAIGLGPGGNLIQELSDEKSGPLQNGVPLSEVEKSAPDDIVRQQIHPARNNWRFDSSEKPNIVQTPVNSPAPAMEPHPTPPAAASPVETPAMTQPGSNGISPSAEKSPFATGGLLSMNLGVQIPDRTYVRRFEYLGNDAQDSNVKLQVEYANRASARILIFTIALGTLLLGWWLRRGPLFLQLLYLLVALILPLALLSIAPLILALALQGILLGGVLAFLSWSLVHCHWLNPLSRLTVASRTRGRKVLAALMISLIFAGSSEAQEAAKPVATPAVQVDPHVVIPYQALNDVPTADRVYIPASLFKKLWEAGHPEETPPVKASLPYAVMESNLSARLVQQREGHTIQMQCRWVVCNLTETEQIIPLPMRISSLQQPLLDESPALLRPLENGLTGVLVPTKGIHVVDAKIVLATEANPAQGEFKIATLPIAAGQLTLQIPSEKEGLTLRVNGTSGQFQKSIKEAQTTFLVPIDQGGELALRWQETAARNSMENNLQLETDVLAEVSDVGLKLHHAYELRVRQGAINEISFEVPADVSLQQVKGADVGGWEVNNEKGVRRLKVSFTHPISSETRFQIDLFLNQKLEQGSEVLAINTLVPSGIAREAGLIRVVVPDHLRFRVTSAESLQQVDVSRIQPEDRKQIDNVIPQIAYRFISRPFVLKLEIARRDAEARGTVEHGVQIRRRKTLLASRIVLNLTGAPRRLLEIRLPENYMTMDVVCQDAADWYVSKSEGKQILILELDQPRTGTIEIGLEGHIAKNPQDDSLSVTLPAPVGASRSSTTLGVWCDETYQAALSQAGNWRTLSSQELPDSVKQLRPQLPQFAFQTNDEPEPLHFQLKRATPEFNGDAGILIAVGDATVDYGLTLRWKISNAAADDFTFTVPSWLGHLDFTGEGIRQFRSEEIENGRTRWHISLIDPVRDQYLITAAATIASPADLIIQTPRLEFETTTEVGAYTSLSTQRQFAVLVNLSQNQLSPVNPAQFESVGVDQLPLSMPTELVQQAMEIVQVRPEKNPSWKLQRMERASGSQAVVPSCVLQTVLQMDGSWRTQATLGVRNRGQQFLGLKFPHDSRILSVFVREVPARTVITQLNGETVHLIALPQTSITDLSFDVSLLLSGNLSRPLPSRYQFRGQQVPLPAIQIVTPKESPEFGVSVAQTVWNVFVPDRVDAVPMGRSDLTNVTFHRGSGWIAAQVQMIDLLRGDIAEMKRIAIGSGRYSSSQRAQAHTNLKQLREHLMSQQSRPDASISGDREIADRFMHENSKALQETEEVLRQLESQQMGVLPQSQSIPQKTEEYFGGNRAFITQNNLSLYDDNRDRSDSDQSGEETKSFNFFKQNDSRRGSASSKKMQEEQESREGLKRQLQSQSLGFGSRKAGEGVGQPMAGGIGGMGRGMIGSSSSSNPPFRQGNFDLAAPTFGGVDPQQQDKRPSDAPFGSRDPIFSPRDRAILGLQVRPLSELQISSENVAGAALAKTTTKGLSMAMSIPQTGHELSFDKPGGNPALTLIIRPKTTRLLAIGSIWTILILGLGICLLRGYIRHRTISKSFASLCGIVMLAGAGLALLGQGPLGTFGLVLFVLSGLIRVLLAAKANCFRPNEC